MTPGTRVRLPSTGEVGIVIHVWIDPDHEFEDVYVAFFGDQFPDGKPTRIPYLLRYFSSSLEQVD